jgi:hypothetical protein
MGQSVSEVISELILVGHPRSPQGRLKAHMAAVGANLAPDRRDWWKIARIMGV